MVKRTTSTSVCQFTEIPEGPTLDTPVLHRFQQFLLSSAETDCDIIYIFVLTTIH